MKRSGLLMALPKLGALAALATAVYAPESLDRFKDGWNAQEDGAPLCRDAFVAAAKASGRDLSQFQLNTLEVARAGPDQYACFAHLKSADAGKYDDIHYKVPRPAQAPKASSASSAPVWGETPFGFR
jgi:hypothetical protein